MSAASASSSTVDWGDDFIVWRIISRVVRFFLLVYSSTRSLDGLFSQDRSGWAKPLLLRVYGKAENEACA
jgi:hypothetical protein